MVAAATITSRRAPFGSQGPSSRLYDAKDRKPGTEKRPTIRRAIWPQAAPRPAQAARRAPPSPSRGRNRPAAAPLAPGAPHSGSSSIAPAAARAPLGRRRRGLRSGGGCCSPSRPHRSCRGRRARIWREPRRPPQPECRLDEVASRDVPPRESGSAGSILARSVASIPPHGSPNDIPAEGRASTPRPVIGGEEVFCDWRCEVSS